MRRNRLGSYGGEDSPLDISRVRARRSFHLVHEVRYIRRQGVFAGEVGTPRLLKLFAKYNIKTTWFIPGKYGLRWAVQTPLSPHLGHSLETFPEQMAAVRDAGHEMYVIPATIRRPSRLQPDA